MINYDYNNRMGFKGTITIRQGKRSISVPTDGLVIKRYETISDQVGLYSPYGVNCVVNFCYDKIWKAYNKAADNNKEVVLIDKLKKPVLKNEWDEILKKEDKSLNLNH